MFSPDDSIDAGSMDEIMLEDTPGTDGGVTSEGDDAAMGSVSADESEDELSLELQGTTISAAPDLMTSRQMPTVLSDSDLGDDPDESDSSTPASAGAAAVTQDNGSSAILSAGGLLPGFPRLLPAPPLLPDPRPPTSKPLRQLLPLKPGLVARAVKLEDGTLFSFTPTVSAPSGIPIDMVEDPITEPGPDAMNPPRPQPDTTPEEAAAIAASVAPEPAAPQTPADADSPRAEPDAQAARADVAVQQSRLEEQAGALFSVDAAVDAFPADREASDPAMPSAAARTEEASPAPPTTDAASPAEAAGAPAEGARGSQSPAAQVNTSAVTAGGAPPTEAAAAAEDAAPVEAAAVEEYFTDVDHDDVAGPPAEPGATSPAEPSSESQTAGGPKVVPAGDTAVGLGDDGPHAGEGGASSTVPADAGGAPIAAPVEAMGAAVAPAARSAGAGVRAQADGRAAAAQFMRARGDVSAAPAAGDVAEEIAAAGDGAAATAGAVDTTGADTAEADTGAAIVAYGDTRARGGADSGVDAVAGKDAVAIVPGRGSAAGEEEAQEVPPLPEGVREDRPTDVPTALAARAVSGALTGQTLLPRGWGAKSQVPPRLADAAEAAAASAAAVHANAKSRTDSPFETASIDDTDGGPRREPPPETIIHPFHLTLFAILLVGGVAFAITVINFTTDMGWVWSSVRVLRKLAKSLAFRQTIALLVAIAFVRYGLEPLVRSVRSVFELPGQWERSNEYFILKQVCTLRTFSCSHACMCA